MINCTLVSGWLLLVSVGNESILAFDSKRNLYLAIEEKHIPIDLRQYPENSWARLQVWADCQEERDGLNRTRYCNSTEIVKVRACGPREGMWVNGVQYC